MSGGDLGLSWDLAGSEKIVYSGKLQAVSSASSIETVLDVLPLAATAAVVDIVFFRHQVVTTDAQIAIYNSKCKYVFRRPVTAIRHGSPGVTVDPASTPLFTTPTYPEYPSGQGGYAGAAQQVLHAFVGPDAPAPITVTSRNDPGTSRADTSWHQVTAQVINARVWEGIHFRFSDGTGARVGRQVTDWGLARLRNLGP